MGAMAFRTHPGTPNGVGVWRVGRHGPNGIAGAQSGPHCGVWRPADIAYHHLVGEGGLDLTLDGHGVDQPAKPRANLRIEL